ncbi:snoRNA-binding rRNA-processing protein utp10, partial [Spiromyces aspiralis]
MASSLAKQLSRIRVADRAAGSEKSQLYKASFLFDPRQAANLDVQTIYDIGRNGLSELCSMNGRFAYYSKTLFSEAVKHMDRILQTKKDNEMLDNSIRGFLRELAPYFLTKPAGKALEWLIRRFRIHEFNVRDVLGAFMPYHETKAFSNLLLILHFSPEDMRTFKFLVAQRKSRHPLDRKTLVQQCIHDRSILAFIIDWSIEAARADQSYPVLLSFLATLVSQYIGELPRIDDSALQFIVPYVVKALRLGREELQLAGYIILTALASRISFSKEVLDELAGVMVATSVDLRSTLLCLAQLAHLQPQLAKEFPAEAAARLGERNDVQEALNQLREGYHVGVLCDSLLVTLADNIFADPSHAKLLQALVESSLITSASAAKVCPVLLRRYLDLGFEAAKAGDAVGAAH